MFNLSKEIRVGLLTVVSGTMLYTGFNFLKGSDFFAVSNNYHVIYEDIDGLTISNPVLINGMNIGRVENIQLLGYKNNKLLVTLKINKDVQISDSTTATLSETDLLGAKAIVLKINKGTKILTNNDTLFASVEQGATDAMMQKIDPMLAKLNSTLGNVNNLLEKDTKQSISKILGNLETASSQLSGVLSNANGLIGSTNTKVASLMDSIKMHEALLRPILTNFRSITDSLKKAEIARTVNNANTTILELRKTLEQINKGQGSIGLLVKSDSLHRNLNSTVRHLDSLFIDLKENPKRYVHLSVFGAKDDKKNKKSKDKKDKKK